MWPCRSLFIFLIFLAVLALFKNGSAGWDNGGNKNPSYRKFMSKQLWEEHHRPDIDGLRALAVLPVLLFHARLGCPGGFVGVDIFFVISGYLITSIILKELNAGTFSLIRFWERRIRRILPAFVVVVLATFVAGWFYFLPEDLAKLGKATVAQATLLSNFYFYQQWLAGKNYFAPAVDPSPLQHTWSLAVEEQFYLLFPMLLVFLARSRGRAMTIMLVAMAIISLLLSSLGVGIFPAATFYLLPARSWELLTGALLALIRGRFVLNWQTREAAGLLGFCLTFYAIFSYDKYDPFPGAAAIPPCLGAALIIMSSEAQLSFVGRILAFKPFVFIGLISYSLYLWHYPLLEFLKYPYPLGPRSPRAQALTLLVSTILAIVTWKYVETPFRKRRVFSKQPHLFTFAGVSVLLMFLLGMLVINGNGIPSRYSGKYFSYVVSRKHITFLNSTSLLKAQAGQFPMLGDVQATNQPIGLLIWGDSHAMVLTPVLDELCRRFSWRGVQATHSLTAPVLNYVSTEAVELHGDSPMFNRAVLDYIGKKHVRNVIIAAYWRRYAASDELKTNLLLTVNAVMKLGARVYIMRDVPKQGSFLASKTAFAILHHHDLTQIGITIEEHQEANRGLTQMFDEVSGTGATVLDPAEYFLNDKGHYVVAKNNQVLYWDESHLTVEGSHLLTPLFEPIFKGN